MSSSNTSSKYDHLKSSPYYSLYETTNRNQEPYMFTQNIDQSHEIKNEIPISQNNVISNQTHLDQKEINNTNKFQFEKPSVISQNVPLPSSSNPFNVKFHSILGKFDNLNLFNYAKSLEFKYQNNSSFYVPRLLISPLTLNQFTNSPMQIASQSQLPSTYNTSTLSNIDKNQLKKENYQKFMKVIENSDFLLNEKEKKVRKFVPWIDSFAFGVTLYCQIRLGINYRKNPSQYKPKIVMLKSFMMFTNYLLIMLLLWGYASVSLYQCYERHFAGKDEYEISKQLSEMQQQIQLKQQNNY